MKHDADVGCNGKEGFMSGTAGMWSTCSRKALLDHYNSMKSAGKWCLAGNSYLFFKDPSIIILTHLIVSHVAKSDACSQGLTMLTGHIDVGGSCPKNTYQYREIHCCCGDQSYEDGRSSEKSDETSETKKSYEDGKSSLKSDETSEDDRSSSKNVDKSDESSEEKGHL